VQVQAKGTGADHDIHATHRLPERAVVGDVHALAVDPLRHLRQPRFSEVARREVVIAGGGQEVRDGDADVART
jgi:hypothetical protein